MPLNCTHSLAKREKGARPQRLRFHNEPQQDQSRQTAPKCPFEILHVALSHDDIGAILT
jgi:hypothetical protein